MAVLDITKIEPSKVSIDPHDKTILLYAAPKAGKTTFAAEMDNNLIIAFEHGTRLIAGAMVVEIDGWAEFKQIVRQLTTNPEARDMYRSITIDTIGRAWDKCGDYIISQGKTADGLRAKKLADIPWGQGYALRDKEFINALSSIEAAGYGLKFLAHAKIEQVKVDENKHKTVYSPILPDRQEVINYLNGTIDITMFIASMKDEEGNSVRTLVTREVDNDTVHIHAGGRVAGLPVKIPLSYQSFKGELANAIEKSSGQAVTEELEVQQVVADRPFEEAMQEAKELYTALDPSHYPHMQEFVINIMDNNPDKTRISELEPADQDRLELIITELKSLQ